MGPGADNAQARYLWLLHGWPDHKAGWRSSC